MQIIQTESLTKYYGRIRGVEDLTLEINQGEIFGYLGPNGAGKTTTIRLLLNLIFPTRGRARILGRDIIKESRFIRDNTGYIPGEVHLYPKMTGQELLHYFARFRPDKPPVLKDELVKRLDLNLSPRIRDLSHGTRQKLALVLAFMHDPDLLILDEPTLGLDPLVQQEFYQILKEFKERGKTTFLSSHILPEVERICDRIGILKEGRLVTVESLETMHEKEVRHVEVAFEEDVDPDTFKLPGVSVVSMTNRSFHLRVKGGEINHVVKAIARFKIKDLVFAHASLEEVFLEFYGREEA
ncbi:MAG: ABC transporter ATP-binding protein [Actinomycetota bacterium]